MSKQSPKTMAPETSGNSPVQLEIGDEADVEEPETVDDSDNLNDGNEDVDEEDEEKDRLQPLIPEIQLPKDNTTDDEKQNGVKPKRLPIDGGFAWLICACAFVQQLLSDGQLFTFGVLYLYLIDYYHSGKSETAWVGAALMGTSMVVGPLVGAVSNRYSLRTAGVIGPLITAFGLFTSYFAKDILTLTFTYGVIGGTGLGFMFLTSILACNVYFDKRRAIANGLTMCGSGVGIFVFPPLTVYVLENYGLPGGWLILTGISLNGCVAGAMFRPLPVLDVVKEVDQNDADDEYGENTIETGAKYTPKLNNVTEEVSEIHISKKSSHSFKYDLLDTKPCQRQTEEDLPNKQYLQVPQQNFLNSTHSINTPLKSNLKPESQSCNTSCLSLNTEYWENIRTRGLSRVDICQIGSMHTLPIDVGGTFVTPNNRLSNANLNRGNIIYHEKGAETIYRKISKLFCQFGRCDLLRRPTVLLMILAAVLWTGQSTILTYIVDYGTSVHLDEKQASFLVSIVGITNCVGKILVGFVTDIPRVSSTVVYMFSIIFAGLSSLAIPFVQNYYTLLVIITVFGLCMAAYCSLRAIVVVDTVGVEHLAGALGLIVMFQGIAYVIGPPIAGLIVEETGNFTMTFAVSALCHFLSASVLLPLVCQCGKSNKEKKQRVASPVQV